MTDSGNSAVIDIIGVQFSSFTRSVQFCCEEIGIRYTLSVEHKGVDVGMRTPGLNALNPFGKVPVLIDSGRVLYETQSICRYLDNQFNRSRLQPEEPWLRAQVDQWCAAITAYVDKAIVRNYLLEFLFPKGEGGRVRKDVVAAAIPEVIKTVGILEQQLGKNNYLVANQFTLADVLLLPSIHYLSGAPNNQDLISAKSPLRDYVSRLLARPAAKKVFM